MSINETYEIMDKNTVPTKTDSEKTSTQRNLKRFAPIFVILSLLIVGYASGLHNYLSLNAVAENKALIDGFVADNFFLAMGAYLLIYIIAVAVSFPGASFLTIAGGGIFGWAIGGTLTVIGATIGASIIFLSLIHI